MVTPPVRVRAPPRRVRHIVASYSRQATWCSACSPACRPSRLVAMHDLPALRRLETRLRPDGERMWWEVLREEAAAILASLSQPVTLDVGCGIGSGLGPALRNHPGLRLGMDLDRDAASNPDLDAFVRASADRIPVRSGSVDLLISGFVIEHLADPAASINEFARVLRPGGRAILWTSNLLNYAILASRLTPTAFHNWVRRKAFPESGKDNVGTPYRANT